MNDPRLYLDAGLSPAARLTLSKEDSHYLVSVMRRKTGDGLRLFNGRDGEWSGRLVAAERKAAQIEIVSLLREQAAGSDLWLVFAPLKKTKTDFVVEKASELGVSRILPVTTNRAVAGRINLERFQAVAKEASEQTERLDLPVIEGLADIDQRLADWPQDRPLYFADEAGDDPDQAWGGARGRARPMAEALAADGARKGAILIGPEGGFDPRERERLRRLDFVRPVGLGPRILRAETAAVCALTLWQSAKGDWR